MPQSSPDRVPWAWVGNSRHTMRRMGAVVIGAAVVVNALKAVTSYVSQMNWGYWAISYRHGFIRRGLVGTIFQSMATDMRDEEQQRVVVQIHLCLAVALAVGLLVWSLQLRIGSSPRVRALLGTGTVAVFLSALLPTVVGMPGYLDVCILLISCSAAYLAFRRRLVAAGALAMVGPFVHDAFIFLWLPVLWCTLSEGLASPDRRRAILRSAPLALPLVSTLLVLTLHSNGALLRSLDELPVQWRHIREFQMPLREALARMYRMNADNPHQLALAAAFFVWPAAVAAACAVGIAPGRLRYRVLMAAGATLSPCATLLVAWDLSRFLVWSSYGAFLALCWSARAARESERTDGESTRPLSRRLWWAATGAQTALVVLGTGGPLMFSYYDHTFADYSFGPSWLKSTPAARLSYAWLALYNRAEVRRSFSTADGCLLEGRNLRIDEGCVVVLAPEMMVETKPVHLAKGAYTAHVDVAPLDTCADATGELAVHLRWRLASPRPPVPFDARSTKTVSLEFAIDSQESAMGRVRVDVTTHGGCVRVTSVRIEPRAE